MNVELFIARNRDEDNLQYERIELYDDENVFYRGKVIDSQDINALFNDFINTFSIPSTPATDKVFKYWFEIGVANGLRVNKRLPAYIQVNSIPLKFGEVELEGLSERGQQITNYKITMYGKLTGLNDLFGEDTLQGLPLSEYDFPFNKDNIEAGLQFPALMTLNKGLNEGSDVIMPFILPTDKEIRYNTGDDESTLDIAVDRGRLDIREFRPAIRQIRIIEAIEEKYNISFSREYFNTSSFKNSFMWCNGNEEFNNLSTFKTIDVLDEGTYSTDFDDVIVREDSISIIKDIEALRNKESVFDGQTYMEEDKEYIYATSFKLEITPSNPDALYRVELYNTKSDEVLDFYENRGSYVFYVPENFVFKFKANNNPTFTDTYYYKITTNDEIDFDLQTYVSTNILEVLNTINITLDSLTMYSNDSRVFNVSTNIDIANNLPDMKVSDYIKGIIKQNKLIIRPTSDKDFRVLNIVDYFNKGNILDFTPYIDFGLDVETERYKTYRSIDFKFETSETASQETFKDNTGRYRGDVLKRYEKINGVEINPVYDVDNKNDLSIDIPFEIPAFGRLLNESNTDDDGNLIPSPISLALFQDEEFKKQWVESPCIFYYNGITKLNDVANPKIKIDFLTSGFSYEEDETESQVDNANIISLGFVTICDTSDNELSSQVNNNYDFSDTTISPWHNTTLLKNQYNNYYKDWIELTYNNNTRLKTFTAKNVPYNLISKLELDTSIIVDNDKYNIEEYEINLLNGDIEFILFPSDYNKFGLQPLDNKAEYLYYNAGGAYDSIVVESNQPINIDFQRQLDWVTGDRGTLPAGKYVLSWYVAYNPLASNRQGLLTITSGDKAKVLFLNQKQA